MRIGDAIELAPAMIARGERRPGGGWSGDTDPLRRILVKIRRRRRFRPDELTDLGGEA